MSVPTPMLITRGALTPLAGTGGIRAAGLRFAGRQPSTWCLGRADYALERCAACAARIAVNALVPCLCQIIDDP